MRTALAPRTKPRVLKAPAVRRAELIDCAQRLFLSKGYERTTINDVIDATGALEGRVLPPLPRQGGPAGGDRRALRASRPLARRRRCRTTPALERAAAPEPAAGRDPRVEGRASAGAAGDVHHAARARQRACSTTASSARCSRRWRRR